MLVYLKSYTIRTQGLYGIGNRIHTGPFTDTWSIQSYRKTSGISRIKYQSLNVSCILLQLPSLNPVKPGVKLRMKM